jgi:hypothetical protein
MRITLFNGREVVRSDFGDGFDRVARRLDSLQSCDRARHHRFQDDFASRFIINRIYYGNFIKMNINKKEKVVLPTEDLISATLELN